MKRFEQLSLAGVLLMFMLAVPLAAQSGDRRNGYVDFYVIIDNVPSLLKSYESTKDWFRSELLEKKAVTQDRLTILLATTGEMILDHVVVNDENRATIEGALLEIGSGTQRQALTSSIRSVQDAISRRSDSSRRPCILLASTLGSNSPNTSLWDVLFYSRVEEYPGWKLVTIAPDSVRDQVQRIVRSFASRN